MNPCLTILLLTLATGAAAQAPEPKDFAAGLEVVAEPGPPVQQLLLPEAVYQGVTRADLGDLRVFNAGGIVVPHALCTGAEPAVPSVRQQSLQVFALQAGAPRGVSGRGDTRVTVQTPAGSSVQVVENGAIVGSQALVPGSPSDAGRFVVDARPVAGTIRSLQLGWDTLDGASQAQVSVEASDDLNQWRTVVAATTLLRVAADGTALERNRIDLPEQSYRYLRLSRGDGVPVRIFGVTAETVQPAAAPEPRWFDAQPAEGSPAAEFWFETGRIAPIQAAQVMASNVNMMLRVALESRDDPAQAWRARWTGDISTVEPAPLPVARTFDVTHDRYWRVRVLRGAETLGGGRLALQLAYYPARLRFLMQGEPPYLVGFGSARVPPAQVVGCDNLLEAFPSEMRAGMIGSAQADVAPAGLFGGPEMRVAPPKPTPVRQIALWVALVAGAGVLVAMALALLKRVREGGAGG